MGNHSTSRPMVLVDGKQRISTLKSFLNREFKVFAAASYKDLTWEDKSKLSLYFNVNNLEEEADVVRWYISMNSGGTVHTKKDIDVAKSYLNQLEE